MISLNLCSSLVRFPEYPILFELPISSIMSLTNCIKNQHTPIKKHKMQPQKDNTNAHVLNWMQKVMAYPNGVFQLNGILKRKRKFHAITSISLPDRWNFFQYSKIKLISLRHWKCLFESFLIETSCEIKKIAKHKFRNKSSYNCYMQEGYMKYFGPFFYFLIQFHVNFCAMNRTYEFYSFYFVHLYKLNEFHWNLANYSIYISQ